jgi:integrase
MSNIRQRGKRWQAQIRVKGCKSLSKTFITKREAQTWSYTIESELQRGLYIDRTLAENTLIKDVLHRYEIEVVPKLRSAVNVRSTLKHLYVHFGQISLANIKPTQLVNYRELRLEQVKPATVIHELSLLLRVLKKAHQEWGINLPHGLPNIAMPKNDNGRTRRLEDGEYKKLINALKETPMMQSIVTFAIETAMRRGEIANMSWEDVNRKKRLLHIPKTKTDTPRIIPLSTTAVSILKLLPRRIDGYVFGLRPDSMTQAFNRACKRANIENLRFHDLRHEATSRLFEKGLSITEVATINGHKDLRMLLKYTHLKPEDLIKKINRG